jgi:exodeoxyribonuclease-3
MKIVSFNVNSIRVRLPIVLQWLMENKPEVMCLQETKVQDVDFPKNQFDKAAYKYAFKGGKSYNGVAILSNEVISDVEFGLDNEPKDESRLIKAKINNVTIINTYVPQGYLPESDKFEYKLNWLSRLLKFFEKNFKPMDPILWVGDFNIAPLPIDVYDPETLRGHVCFRAEVHKALNNILSWGLTDLFRMYCKESGQYTFWDYRLPNSVKRNLGWRLDHIMATKPLAKKCTSCYIDKKPRIAERPSDHTPIVAEFDL